MDPDDHLGGGGDIKVHDTRYRTQGTRYILIKFCKVLVRISVIRAKHYDFISLVPTKPSSWFALRRGTQYRVQGTRYRKRYRVHNQG